MPVSTVSIDKAKSHGDGDVVDDMPTVIAPQALDRR